MPVVIKYGGNAMSDSRLRGRVAAAIGRAAVDGRQPVVVHGGGPFIGVELQRAGVESRFVRGLRVTSEEAIGPVETALTLLGKRLAQQIGNAVALTGRDSSLLLARTVSAELGRVGTITGINASLLTGLLGIGVTPVIACLALDAAGEPLNVNADDVAASVAGALAAPVIFLTNVPGVQEDPDEPDSLLPSLDRAGVQERIIAGTISGGMIPKVESALAALDRGAAWSLIADGTAENGLEQALNGEAGTRIVP